MALLPCLPRKDVLCLCLPKTFAGLLFGTDVSPSNLLWPEKRPGVKNRGVIVSLPSLDLKHRASLPCLDLNRDDHVSKALSPCRVLLFFSEEPTQHVAVSLPRLVQKNASTQEDMLSRRGSELPDRSIELQDSINEEPRNPRV